MKAKEIEKIYSEKVEELLNNGYRISIGTCRGSQGEIAKIDLKKDKTVVRVKLESKWLVLGKHDYYTPHKLFLEVGVCEGIEEPTDPFKDSIDYLWNDDFVTLESTIWVELSDNWFIPYDDAKDIVLVREERQERAKQAVQSKCILFPFDAAKYVLKRVRREKGLKTAMEHDIVVEKWLDGFHGQEPGYYATVKGRTIKL